MYTFSVPAYNIITTPVIDAIKVSVIMKMTVIEKIIIMILLLHTHTMSVSILWVVSAMNSVCIYMYG